MLHGAAERGATLSSAGSPLTRRLASACAWAAPLILSCGPAPGVTGREGARIPPDEQAARAPWSEALRSTWRERRADARWLRETLIVGLAAAAEVERARVPAEARVAALERSDAGSYRVHLGRLLHAQDPGSMQVHRRIRITWRGTAQAPDAVWEPLPQPEALHRTLAEELRALSTTEAHLERLRRGWRDELRRTHQVSHHPFVRRRARGKIEVWLVPFSTVPTQVVLGGDYRVIVDPTGRRVESFTALHAGMTRIRLPAASPDEGPRPEVRNHLHGPMEGDLPAATDLLKIATSPALGGLAVIGPRFALLVTLGAGGMDWRGQLYFSSGFRALLDTPSR